MQRLNVMYMYYATLNRRRVSGVDSASAAT